MENDCSGALRFNVVFLVRVFIPFGIRLSYACSTIYFGSWWLVSTSQITHGGNMPQAESCFESHQYLNEMKLCLWTLELVLLELCKWFLGAIRMEWTCFVCEKSMGFREIGDKMLWFKCPVQNSCWSFIAIATVLRGKRAFKKWLSH